MKTRESELFSFASFRRRHEDVVKGLTQETRMSHHISLSSPRGRLTEYIKKCPNSKVTLFLIASQKSIENSLINCQITSAITSPIILIPT